jgi:hypothetical protein
MIVMNLFRLVKIKVARKQEFLSFLNIEKRLWVRGSDGYHHRLMTCHSKAWLLKQYKAGKLYLSF